MIKAPENHRSLHPWRSPSSFTSLVPLATRPEVSKQELIAQARWRIEVQKDPMIKACEKVEGIHSLRLVVVPSLHEDDSRPKLLINIVHDYIEASQALEVALPIIQDQLSNTLGVDTVDSKKACKQISGLFLSHEIEHRTLFLANINASVAQIRQQERLYGWLQRKLDALVEANERLHEGSARQIHQMLLRAYRGEAPDELPTEPTGPVPPQGVRAGRLDLVRSMFNPVFAVLYDDIFGAVKRSNRPARALRLALAGLYILCAGVIALPALVVVRIVEWFEPDEDMGGPTQEALRRIEDSEDQIAKNTVTLVFPTKPSWVRRLLINEVLRQAEQGCRHLWTNGRLIQIRTIHYARILLTPSRRTMLFISDYDGSLDRYLDDFLGVGKRAVVPISSNVHGCPPTKWLGTPADISTFRPRWRSLIRKHQVPESFWFNAYPDLSTSQVRNHHEVRQGLFDEELSEEDAAKWLRRL